MKRKHPGEHHRGPVGAMIEAAFEANAIAERHFETHLVATYKDEHNVACAVDGEIEARIRDVLQGHHPGYRFYGEEGGDADRSAPAVAARRFLVDPLDGTRNFLARRQEFCTAIACQEWTGADWLTTDGVVAHAASGRVFWASRGGGAFVIERSDLEHPGAVLSTEVDAADPLRNQLIDYSARGLDLEAQVEVFRALVVRGTAVRNSGSVALILANMAGCGGAGAIITAKDYDVEAGRLIAHEAGAWVTQLRLAPGADGLARTCTVVGADARVHGALTDLVRGQIVTHGGRIEDEVLSPPPG